MVFFIPSSVAVIIFEGQTLEQEEHPEDERIAAVIATLVEHQRGQQAAQVVRRNERDTSNWKWIARWERMQR